MKIALVFGDNDFWKTQYNLMKTLNDAFQWNELPDLNKEEICFIINELSMGFYLLFQCRDISEVIQNSEKQKDYKDYLFIKPSDVLIDDEVDEYIKENCGNSSTNIIDTDIYTNGVKTGYVWTF